MKQTFVIIGQRLIKIIGESGLIRKSDVDTFPNWPRAADAPNNTVHDGLYMATETP